MRINGNDCHACRAGLAVASALRRRTTNGIETRGLDRNGRQFWGAGYVVFHNSTSCHSRPRGRSFVHSHSRTRPPHFGHGVGNAAGDTQAGAVGVAATTVGVSSGGPGDMPRTLAGVSTSPDAAGGRTGSGGTGNFR